MAEFRKARIADLCEITSSKRIFAADYVSEGVPFYRGKEITEKYKGSLDVSTELFITEEKFSEIERKFGAPRKGDLLLTSVGTLGSPYVVKPGERFYFKDGNLTWFRYFQELDSKFLYYWLVSPQGKAELQKCTIGSSQSAFTIVLLKGMEIELPPLPIQRRIAGVLSAYDELIENNQRRIRILEEMARSLYREWFVHFHYPGHESVQLADSPLGHIPQGWEVMSLNDVVDDIVDYRGKTPTKLNGEWSDEGILALSALNVKGGRLVNLEKSRCINEDLYSRWMKNPLRRGDILMTSEAPLGELFFLCKEERYCLSQRLFSIRANRSVIAPVILYLCLESEQTQHELRSRASGATVSGIRQSELRNVPIVVPSRPIQESVEPVLLRFVEQIATLNESLINLRRTRDLLLPRLLSGQVALDT